MLLKEIVKKIPIAKKSYFILRKLYFSIVYSGNKIVCPLCSNSYRKLISSGLKVESIYKNEIIGGGFRENCICPNCNSSDRERLLYLFLRDGLKIFERNNLNILHIAPEKSLRKMLKSQFDNYISGDLKPDSESIKVNITNIPFEGNCFDLIICSHVLEHVENDYQAASEFFRVLKNGGHAILQVPFSKKINATYENWKIVTPKEREQVFGQSDHVRIYGRDYVKRIETVGFKYLDYSFNENINKEITEKYALIPEEKIFCFYKP